MAFGLFGKKDQSQGDAYTSTLPTVNAYPVYDAQSQLQVQAIPPPIAPSHVPPPPPQTYTPPSPSPIVDNSNTEFFVLLGRQPTIMKQCPKCKIPNIRTRVKTYPSVASWLMTIGMIFLKKSDHYCGCCGKRIGSVTPLSDCGVMHYS
eukprot:scaffold271159_cov99-Cyclotella_meneghiniana.AAC.3